MCAIHPSGPFKPRKCQYDHRGGKAVNGFFRSSMNVFDERRQWTANTPWSNEALSQIRGADKPADYSRRLGLMLEFTQAEQTRPLDQRHFSGIEKWNVLTRRPCLK